MIDDAAEILDFTFEGERKRILEPEIEDFVGSIKPEEEFIGHCSNLQIWYEIEYDSRLLHSN